jgi:3-deoxy-D-manno-octulosonic-acid transferase
MRLLPWLLNLAYGALLLAMAPIVLYRAIAQGKYRDGWGEKLFGLLPVREADGPCIWFHAVSVGEVLQLRSVLVELRSHRPDVQVLITTTTVTGHAVAREKNPDCRVCYFPLDFSWAVRRAIVRVRPSLIVLVELELWPNVILAARRLGVPLALINGRISERSFRGYCRLRPLMRRLLARFDLLAAQTETYAGRLRNLGAPPERLCITGSIKFDHIATDRHNRRTLELRQAFGLREDERVFIAGSTQLPEEDYALDTWLALRSEFPDLRLILVPRHKERFDEVARLVEERGLPLARRSECENAAGSKQKVVSSQHETTDYGPRATDTPVLLLDTLGELAACWGLASIAFVGGSLTRRGGQNMIEPAAYGAAVLFGPNTWNFRDIVDVLLAGRAARVVSGPEELTRTVAELLRDPAAAREQGRRAQELVLAQQGATRRTLERLVELLPPARRSVDRAEAA